MFPYQVELAVAGNTLRTASRTNVVINPEFPADAFTLPDAPRTEIDAAKNVPFSLIQAEQVFNNNGFRLHSEYWHTTGLDDVVVCVPGPAP